MKLVGMLLCSSLIPFIMLVFGYSMRYKTKKRGNPYGFKTKLSMRSDEDWIYANRLCGLVWLILGSILEAICIITISMYFNNNDIIKYISMGNIIMQLIAMMLSWVFVNMKLKNRG